MKMLRQYISLKVSILFLLMFNLNNTFSKEKNKSYLQFTKIETSKIVNIYEKNKIKVFYNDTTTLKGKFYITNDSIITINNNIIHLSSVKKIVSKNIKATKAGIGILSMSATALLTGGINDIIRGSAGGDVGFQKARGTTYAGLLMLYPSIIGAFMFCPRYRFALGTKWHVKIIQDETNSLE